MADEKKSWLDEKMDAAKEKAAAEAGKALVSGVVGAASQQLDSWLGAMEGELARRQQADAPKAALEDAPPYPATAKAPPARPSPEERQQASAAELVRMKAQAQRAPQVDLVDDVAPKQVSKPQVEAMEELEEVGFEELPDAPVDEERGSADHVRHGVEVTPVVEPWVRPDPMAAAEAALQRARVARGLPAVEPRVEAPSEAPRPQRSSEPRDPFAAAREALEKAQAARASVGRSAVQVDREERARKELDLLKGRAGRADDAPADGDGDDATPEVPKGPPKRRL